MTKHITISDELYELLASKARGFETPDDVLRREFGLDRPPPTTPTSGPADGPAGGLRELVTVGLVHPGDIVSHHRKSRGETFSATVDENGWLITAGGHHRSPSPALTEYLGYQINGWTDWTHEPSGQTLAQLRSRL